MPHLLHFTAIVKKSSGQNPHLKRDLFNAIPNFFSKQRNDFVQKSNKGKKKNKNRICENNDSTKMQNSE